MDRYRPYIHVLSFVLWIHETTYLYKWRRRLDGRLAKHASQLPYTGEHVDGNQILTGLSDSLRQWRGASEKLSTDMEGNSLTA